MPRFREILKEVSQGLKYVFQTENEVFIFASSGTGAMEAAVANLLSPGDTALTVEGGKFGERWTEICKSYGINTEVIKVEWGRPVEPQEIKTRLQAPGSKIQAVFTTLCETSTGVTNDIQAIGKIIKDTNAVLVVDAISGLGVIPLQTDEWFCDIVVSGSQKGLMLPPGLGFISVSPKAWGLIERSRSPKYYFDLKKAKESYDKTTTAFTPAISLIIALREVLNLIKKEGLQNLFNRHRKMAQMTRQAMQELGLKLFAPEASSDAITAVRMPPEIDADKLVKLMRDDYGITIAGGQARLKGKIFRIAHMGYIRQRDITAAISGLKKALRRLGYKSLHK
jgi:aspartate aminotransferase-like enzyme